MTPPALAVALLCRYAFQLPPLLGAQWWTALQASPHTTCRFVVRRLTRYKGTPDHLGPWLMRVLSPKTLIYATESLFEESRLSRADASTIEEAILGLMTKEGTWK